MKIFGQIVSILPLALVISLPNQLFAHVPITNISSQLTAYLEREDADSVASEPEDEDEEETLHDEEELSLDVDEDGCIRNVVNAKTGAVLS